MKSLLVLACAAVLSLAMVTATACGTPADPPRAPVVKKPLPVYLGDDGSSLEKAIVIAGAESEEEGVTAEYRWIDAHFPGWKHDVNQATLYENKKTYDQLQFTDANGKKQVIYFDISGFFGKF